VATGRRTTGRLSAHVNRLAAPWSWKSDGPGLEGADREGESPFLCQSLSTVRFNSKKIGSVSRLVGVGSPGLQHLGAVVGYVLTSSQACVGEVLTIRPLRRRRLGMPPRYACLHRQLISFDGSAQYLT
jgi:hypothetical protein